MSSLSLSGLRSVLSPTVRDAVQLERDVDRSTWRPKHIAVVPLDQNALTSVVTSIIAVIGSRLLDEAPVAVDPSPALGLSYLLGSRQGGGLRRLADNARTPIERRAIADYVTVPTAPGAPVIALPSGGSALTPAELHAAIDVLKRRYRAVLIDVSPAVANELLDTSLTSSSKAIAVTSATTPPGWLFSTSNPLTPFLQSGTLAIAQPFAPFHVGKHEQYRITTPTFGLGIQSRPDGTWNLPAGPAGLALSDGTVELTQAAIRLGEFCFTGSSDLRVRG